MAADDVAYTTINTTNSDRFQSLRRELGIEGFGMNVITLAPRQRGRIHDHERQEEVYLVEGELTLGIEGKETVVSKHGLARVPPGVRRQLLNRSPSTTLLLLALGADGRHTGRDGRAWESWEDAGEGRSPQDVPLPADLPV